MSDCIPWTGQIQSNGYGYLKGDDGQKLYAHRVAYELNVGPIPDGKHIDHLCHGWDGTCRGGDSCIHRRCVNPAHLEPVTPRENTRRGVVARNGENTCARGHQDQWAVRPGGRRSCAECRRLVNKKRRRNEGCTCPNGSCARCRPRALPLGVIFRPQQGKYEATVRVSGRPKYLGRHATVELAVEAIARYHRTPAAVAS